MCVYVTRKADKARQKAARKAARKAETATHKAEKAKSIKLAASRKLEEEAQRQRDASVRKAQKARRKAESAKQIVISRLKNNARRKEESQLTDLPSIRPQVLMYLDLIFCQVHYQVRCQTTGVANQSPLEREGYSIAGTCNFSCMWIMFILYFAIN